jgi:hypothetical protein
MAEAPGSFGPLGMSATGEVTPKSKLEMMEEGSTLAPRDAPSAESQSSGTVVAETLTDKDAERRGRVVRPDRILEPAPDGEPSFYVDPEAVIPGVPPFDPAPPVLQMKRTIKLRKALSKTARKAEPGPDGGRDPRPAAWVFYATAENAQGEWRQKMRSGLVWFWRHGLTEQTRGGPSYSKTVRRGDRVIVLAGDEIVATAVLAGDGRMTFNSPDNARQWPIQYVEVFERPAPREAIEVTLGHDLASAHGSLHPIWPDELERLVPHLRELTGRETLWPADRTKALALIAGGALRQAALDWPELQVDPETREALLLDRPDALPPVINDTPDAPDLLGIDPEVTAFARLAISRQIVPPLSIGLFGDWGSGKSFFMEKVKAKIEDLADFAAEQAKVQPGLLHHQVPQIRFNAWHYIETNLWASLVEYIFAELDRWLKKQEGVEPAEVDALFDRLATSRRLKLEAFTQLVNAKKEASAANKALDEARAEYRKVKAEPLTQAQIWTAVADGFLADAPEEDRKQLKAVGETLGIAGLETSGEAAAKLVAESADQAVRGRLVLEGIIARIGSFQAAAAIVAVLLGPPALLWWLSLKVPEIVAGGVPQMLATAAVSLSGLTLLGRHALSVARGQLAVLDRLRVRLDTALAEKTKEERGKMEAGQAAAAQAAQAVVEAERRAVEAGDRVAALLREQSELSAGGRLNRFIRDKAMNGDYARHLGIIASVHKDFAQLSALLGDQGTLDKAKQDKMEEARKAYFDAAQLLIRQAEEAKTPLTPEQQAELLEVGGAEPSEGKKTPSIGRIVLYIDDLDRCPPEKVVDVLQAIHMLLYFKLFVVFVAVDERWLKRSLGARFEGLIEDSSSLGGSSGSPVFSGERSAASAQDYLEKIFQIPFSVTPMDSAASAKFVGDLTLPLLRAEVAPKKEDASAAPAAGQAPAGGAAPDPFDDVPLARESPLLAPEAASRVKAPSIDLTSDEQAALQAFGATLGGSPRRTKRFVNTYLLIKIALRQKPDLPQAEDAAWPLAALLAVVVGYRSSAEVFFNNVWQDRLSQLKDRLHIEPRPEGAPPYDVVLEPVLSAMSRHPESFEPILLGPLIPIVRRYAF